MAGATGAFGIDLNADRLILAFGRHLVDAERQFGRRKSIVHAVHSAAGDDRKTLLRHLDRVCRHPTFRRGNRHGQLALLGHRHFDGTVAFVRQADFRQGHFGLGCRIGALRPLRILDDQRIAIAGFRGSRNHPAHRTIVVFPFLPNLFGCDVGLSGACAQHCRQDHACA